MSTAAPPLSPELDAALERLAWALARNLAERYKRTGSVAPPGAPLARAQAQHQAA